jgi:hypothetical protein
MAMAPPGVEIHLLSQQILFWCWVETQGFTYAIYQSLYQWTTPPAWTNTSWASAGAWAHSQVGEDKCVSNNDKLCWVCDKGWKL